ncbi:MAG: Hsp20/alpha crystallin family protein [Armatimonadetes bacterium]|nr:Hsp20/alpha crystallin family protein [Armatimonadota bacterium]
MDVLRWGPFDDIRAIQDEVNRLFEQRAGSSPPAARRENVSTRVWTPAVDVIEDQEEIVLRVDLPGVNQDEIKIELTGENLTISGSRPLPGEDERSKYVRVERQYGPFQRSFTIGVPLHQDKVTADYTDGVLEVHLPKSEETKPKRVEVKVGGG